MEMLFYSVLFCPPKSIPNSFLFCLFNVLGFCLRSRGIRDAACNLMQVRKLKKARLKINEELQGAEEPISS